MKQVQVSKSIAIQGYGGRPMLTDLFHENTSTPQPLIIYMHGFNGFKDWANFDLIAKQFAQAGFAFVKFNSSHNGTTTDHPEDFTDLEAYGHNNYSKELYDLGRVIDFALSPEAHPANIDESKIYLLGHSRGGGVVLIKAAEDTRVKAVTTWASVSEAKTPWGSWSQERMENWRKTGVEYYTNSRTNQQLPLYYQLYEDYQANKDRQNIQAAIASLTVPVLLCHGTFDTSVPVEKAHLLHQWQPSSELFLVESDHVFGRKHRWTEPNLPPPMQQVLDRTIDFFAMLS